MQFIYVRSPGPGAIIRLLERFQTECMWEIKISPADPQSGYRGVVVLGVDTGDFAVYLAERLDDGCYHIEEVMGTLIISRVADELVSDGKKRDSLIQRAGWLRVILKPHFYKRALRDAKLPFWLLRMHRLREIPYETIAVLDRRDLLVEAQDVIYTAKQDSVN